MWRERPFRTFEIDRPQYDRAVADAEAARTVARTRSSSTSRRRISRADLAARLRRVAPQPPSHQLQRMSLIEDRTLGKLLRIRWSAGRGPTRVSTICFASAAGTGQVGGLESHAPRSPG